MVADTPVCVPSLKGFLVSMLEKRVEPTAIFVADMLGKFVSSFLTSMFLLSPSTPFGFLFLPHLPPLMLLLSMQHAVLHLVTKFYYSLPPLP
jgi:hypothetical protein